MFCFLFLLSCGEKGSQSSQPLNEEEWNLFLQGAHKADKDILILAQGGMLSKEDDDRLVEMTQFYERFRSGARWQEFTAPLVIRDKEALSNINMPSVHQTKEESLAELRNLLLQKTTSGTIHELAVEDCAGFRKSEWAKWFQSIGLELNLQGIAFLYSVNESEYNKQDRTVIRFLRATKLLYARKGYQPIMYGHKDEDNVSHLILDDTKGSFGIYSMSANGDIECRYVFDIEKVNREDGNE